MPSITQDNLLTLDAGLAHFKAVLNAHPQLQQLYPREEYESEPTEFIAFLTARNLTVWRSVRPYIAPHDGHALPSEGGDLKSVQEMFQHELDRNVSNLSWPTREGITPHGSGVARCKDTTQRTSTLPNFLQQPIHQAHVHDHLCQIFLQDQLHVFIQWAASVRNCAGWLDGTSTMEAPITAGRAASSRRANHRCSVLGWPWRMDFSRADSLLMASRGRATWMSFLLWLTRFPSSSDPRSSAIANMI